MRNEGLMRIWFAAWNADVERARAAYDKREEGLARFRVLLGEGRLPELCRAGTHKLFEAAVRWEKNGWRCMACHNEGQNRRYRKKHPVRRKVGPKKRLSPTREKEVAHRYKEGTSTRILVAEYGVSKPTILRAVRNSGVSVRGRRESARAAQPRGESPQLTAEQRAAIVARYKEGASSSNLAKEFDVAAMTVLRTIRNAGVPARTRSESMKISHADRRYPTHGRTAP